MTVLSTYAEWHSFILGIFDGLKTWRLKPRKMRNNKDVQKEPHYYSAGYVIATSGQAGFVLTFLYLLWPI